MAESTTDRISRLGSADVVAALAFGVVLGIVLVVAGVLAVVGVDTVEVVATVLVAAVFGVGLFAGQRAGLFAAGLATLAYVALRRATSRTPGPPASPCSCWPAPSPTAWCRSPAPAPAS